MKNIYLFHQTDYEYIHNIIDSKLLLSSYITKSKNQNPFDIYLPYIFVNCCIKEDFKYLFLYTFIFPYTILYDRTFYIDTCHSAGNINSAKYFSKNTSKIKIYNELSNLLIESKNKAKNWKKTKFAAFLLYQEIFFRKKINIFDALYIVVPKYIDIKLLNKIKYNLPKIKIIYSII